MIAVIAVTSTAIMVGANSARQASCQRDPRLLFEKIKKQLETIMLTTALYLIEVKYFRLNVRTRFLIHPHPFHM